MRTVAQVAKGLTREDRSELAMQMRQSAAKIEETDAGDSGELEATLDALRLAANLLDPHIIKVKQWEPDNKRHVAPGWGWRCSCRQGSWGWDTEEDARRSAQDHWFEAVYP